MEERARSASVSSTASIELSTPSITEGESGSETDGPHTDSESDTENEAGNVNHSHKRRQRLNTSFSVGTPKTVDRKRTKYVTSQHDLFNKYLRKDVVFLHNIYLLR